MTNRDLMKLLHAVVRHMTAAVSVGPQHNCNSYIDLVRASDIMIFSRTAAAGAPHVASAPYWFINARARGTLNGGVEEESFTTRKWNG